MNTFNFESIIHANVYVLLTLWHNLGFFLALQVWQLINGFGNNLQGSQNLFFRDDERGCQSYDVLVSRFGLRIALVLALYNIVNTLQR